MVYTLSLGPPPCRPDGGVVYASCVELVDCDTGLRHTKVIFAPGDKFATITFCDKFVSDDKRKADQFCQGIRMTIFAIPGSVYHVRLPRRSMGITEPTGRHAPYRPVFHGFTGILVWSSPDKTVSNCKVVNLRSALGTSLSQWMDSIIGVTAK